MTVPAGGFSIDGDLLAGVPVAGAGDWLAGTNGPAYGVLDANGKPLNPATTFHFVDPYSSSADNTFAGGLKWGDNPNTWQWTTGKPSSKTDINNVLMHIATDAAGHVWVILGADRASTSGDSYIDFEFLQNPLIRTNNGRFVSSGPDGGRTVNDLLLSLAFTSGGSVADFFAWRWVTNGSGGFAYSDATAALPAGGVFVAANSNSTAVPYGAFGQTTYGPNAFAEAAVDLTALLGNFDPCLSLGINTVMVKTKSSQSGSSTIIDFIDPIQYTMKFGPSANAGPDQTQCIQAGSTAFSLQGKATQGLRPIISTNWTVIAGAATFDDPGSLSTTAHVTSDTATLRLTVATEDGCTETDDVVLRVAPLPVCAIAGSALVCPQSTNSFAGPAGMASYAWSVSGNGSILGATNSPIVSVRAGSDCGTNFALGLTVVSNGCSSACEFSALVNDVNPPTITAPADLVLECPADTRTNATGVASAQDDCGRVTVTYTDAVTNGSGNTMTIARTWTAVDLCGNAASAVQMITVRDTTLPRITAPANRILECPADTSTNNTGVATAQDTCGPTVISYSDVVSNSCGGTKVISRLWTAVDASGNTASALQTITVRDTTPPTITAPPSLTLECPADTGTNATGVAVAQDTCGQVTITFSDSVSNTCGSGQVIRRTWSAADECGNRATALQTITVRDTTAPAITPPPDLVLECPADTRTNVTGVATAQDACGTVSFSYSDSVSNSCGGTKVIARTWTARDACGNSASAAQRITVRDTMPPTITAPPNLTLECPANTGTNATGVAVAQDGCGSVTVGYSDVISNSCGGAKVISRTWVATDACGNAASALQVIMVRDTTPPTITAPPSVTLECPANPGTNATGVATAQDGCGAVTISYSDSVSNSCGGAKVISRTWLAMDACGNAASALQVITVRDTTLPTITAPPNLTLECPANTGTNATGVAVAQDGCGAVTIGYSDVVSNSCGGTKGISRTWIATDACGNSASALQKITVRDTTPPTITAPPNLTLECPANTGTNATGVAVAQDGCGAVTITYSDVVSNSCGGTKVIARTWLAADACGNSASALQTITVRDTTPPTLTAPADVVLECPADTRTNVTGVATAQDGCGAVTIRYSDVVSNSCGGTKVVFRTWLATDACGNSISALQRITVRDTTPPTITAPPNLTLECPANTGTNATGVAVAQDGCGSVTISYSDVVSNSCGSAKVSFRTWRATDACGNQATAVQTITVRDTTPPTITVPADLVLECPADTRTNATGTATGQDGCGAVAISYSDVVSNSCGGAKLITRTWTAADGCGNSVSGVQRITVRDTTPPSFQLPANVVLECPGDTRTNVTGVPIAVDGCGAVTVTYSDVVSNSCGLTRTIWRLWTAADGCGNSTNGVQTITVVDTTKPTITCPAVQVQCPGDVPAPYADLAAFLAAGGKASDTCGTTLTFALVSGSGLVGSCPGTVTRVYRLTDACGNFSEATQIITVRDTIAPVIVCPTNRTVDCGLALTPANTGAATATDNCDTNVSLSYTDAIVPSSYEIKLYAADPDTGAGPYGPTYLKLAPANLPCPQAALLTGRAIDPLRNAVAYASTNGQLDALTSMGGAPMCFGQVVPFEVVIGASGGPGMDHGTIEFTASWSTHTTANNAFGYDTNYMVYCAFVDIADPGLVDPNLNARVESYSSTVVNAGTINEQIQGTFRVTGLDSGDRVVVEIWLVLMSAPSGNVGGTIAAELVSAQKASVPPEPITIGNQTVSIGNLSKISPLPAPQPQPPAPPPTPQASVPPGITVSIVDRTWTATDTCGNHSSCVQRITVRATAAPALVVPPDVVLECPADTSTNGTGVATAPNGCGSVTITFSDSVTNNADGSKVIARTWTAVDFYGNGTNAVQRIVVRDTTPPALTVPPDLVLECPAGTGTNATGAATASDGCGSAVVTFSDSVSNTCGLASVLRRTWTATDSAGNSTNAVQTIAVRDTTPPTLVAAVDRTVQEAQSWSFDEPTAADNCGAAAVLVVNTATNFTSTNTLVATRTWLATDACGNASPTRQQHITVILPPPVIPPTITEQPVCRATASGTGANLSVTATGTGPLSYQWRFNGSNIAGATGSTLTLSNLQFTNAGLYSVVVSNSAGVAVSSPAIVNVAPQISAQLTAKGLRLSWPAPFILQAAATVGGPFTDVAGATSPYLQDTASPMRFFRLRSPTYDVIVSYSGAGAAGLTVNGPPGWNFIIQASSDYMNWVNLATNTAPCTYVDESAPLYKFRTYRVVLTAPTGTAAAPIAAATITDAPLGQTTALGGGTTLSVTASGTGPLAYQWRLNGTNIAGATASTLNLANLQFRDAGCYSVTVSNAGGVVTSTAAIVNVAPRLSWQQVAGGLQLSWPSPYILQCAKNAEGPYADVPGATSPFLQATAGPRKFFRLRATPADVIVTTQPNGAASLSLVGAPGWNYVVQASSDYAHWVDLFTGTAPATYLDSTAGQYPVRVYRAVAAQ